MTNKTTKLIELIQVIYTQKGNGNSRENLGIMLNDLVRAAREEGIKRGKQEMVIVADECEKEGWSFKKFLAYYSKLLSNPES